MTTKQTKKTSARATTKKVAKKVTTQKAIVEQEIAMQQSKLIHAVEVGIDNVQGLAKKVWFAGLGAFGRSVDEVQTRYEQANEDLSSRYSKLNDNSQKLVKELVDRGEKVQNDAEERVKESRANIEEQIEQAKTRLAGLVSVVDIPARLQEVSDRIESLSKDLKKSA